MFQLPIFFPVLFLICDLFILALTIYQQPKESLSNVVLMLAAIPIYWVGVSWEKKPKKVEDFLCKYTFIHSRKAQTFECLTVIIFWCVFLFRPRNAVPAEDLRLRAR